MRPIERSYRIETLRQQRDDLLAALEPFAALAGKIPLDATDKATVLTWQGVSLTTGDLRRAAEAVRKARGG